jgi:uncharacterized protein (TIGR03437 family)
VGRFRRAMGAISFFCLACAAHAAESDALAISANIQARHMPFGTILDPVYASSTSNQIVGYTRCGDSALWTGAYLAAESFRFYLTQSANAASNVQKAFAGLKSLVGVTGTDVLARCVVPSDSPFAAGIESEESANGAYQNPPNVWIGNTSRDEYVGAMFGLAVAYDYAGGAVSQSDIAALITRMVSSLMNKGWTIVMPNGSLVDTFLDRPEELLMLLAVASHANPAQFSSAYATERALLDLSLVIPISVDITNNGSYFKFNLDYMSFYNLLRLDSGSGSYKAAYDILRGYTASHQNAFFDIIDHSINGYNSGRDTETAVLLQEWLSRPGRDFYVNLTNTVKVCGSEACAPVPVPLRPPTDFLWQRDPFQLMGGLSGTIESAGIDYILPYWMARVYSVLSTFGVESAAAAIPAVAPGSIASLYGSGLTNGTAQPSVTVTDSTRAQRAAQVIYASPTQINFVVPNGTAVGAAAFGVSSGGTALPLAAANVQNVAPALFSADGSGTGVAAATAIQVNAGAPQLQFALPVFQCFVSGCTALPLALGVDTPIFLSLYGTGIRNFSSLSNVQVTIGGIAVPVLYAGPQGSFPGLDQVNVPLTLNLRGMGLAKILLTVDGQNSNAVMVDVQ